jgi:hypothetical protein
MTTDDLPQSIRDCCTRENAQNPLLPMPVVRKQRREHGPKEDHENIISVPNPTTRPIAWVGRIAINANVKNPIDPLTKAKWTYNRKTVMPMIVEIVIAKGILSPKLTMKHSAYHRT